MLLASRSLNDELFLNCVVLVFKAGQTQDFLHFFSSNTPSVKTHLSTYLIFLGNQSWDTKENLSIKLGLSTKTNCPDLLTLISL